MYVPVIMEAIKRNAHAFNNISIERLAQHFSSTIRSKCSVLIKFEVDRASICALAKSLMELHTTFAAQIAGCVHILKLSLIPEIYDDDYKEVTTQIQELLNCNINSTFFNNNFFKSKHDDDFWLSCLNIGKRFTNDDKSVNLDAKSKFCRQIITSIAEDSNFVETNPILSSDITEATFNIIAQNDIDIDSFLVEGIINEENTLLANICFDFMVQILVEIDDDDDENIGSYFIFFQNLLTQQLDPDSSDLNVQQQRIFQILQFFFEDHFRVIGDLIDDKLAVLLELSVIDYQDLDFKNIFRHLEENPTKENYSKLLAILRSIKVDDFLKAQMESFYEFIKLMEMEPTRDYKVYTIILCEMLKAIRNGTKIDDKVKLLMRLQKIISKKMPLEAKKIVMEIILDCLPEKRCFCGLEKFIDSTLEVFLTNCALRYEWNSIIEETSAEERFKLNDQIKTIPNKAKLSRRLKFEQDNRKKSRKRKAVDKNDAKKARLDKNLKAILRFSDWLKSENLSPSRNQKQLIDQIIQSLQPLTTSALDKKLPL